MLDRITAAAAEVAATAIFAARFANMLGDVGQVRCLEQLFTWRSFHWFGFTIGIQRMAGIGTKFFVSAGIVMAGKAVDIALVGKVETIILPAVASVTTGTAGFVGYWRAAEIIGSPFFSEGLAGRWTFGFP